MNKIKKYQKGNSIENPFIKQFNNIMIGASMAENPEVMQASGWKQNKNGDYIQEQNKDDRKLANNLMILSTTNPLINILNLYKPLVYKGVSLNSLLKYKIGEGAEAVVFENTPNKVIKIIYNGFQKVKNHIPNTAKVKRVGETKEHLPIYTQQKLNTNFNWNKTLKKLDKNMQNKGYQIISDPKVQYRAYRHNGIVIDDISPDNVGITVFRKPKILDFNFQTIPEWIELGYKLQLGGKIKLFKSY